MRMPQAAYLAGIIPGSARGHTILAFLLWSGVIIFIFGILVDFFH